MPGPVTLALLAVGGITLLGKKGKGRPRGPCPSTGHSGGQMAGLNFIQDISGGASPSDRLPLIVFFHSRGASPEGAHAMENRLKIPARILTPQGPESIGGAYGWYLSRAKDKDQATLAYQMANVGKQTAAFIADAARCFPTIGAPIVTGSSQGAGMAYLMASLYPRLVAGAVGVSGWLPQSLWNSRAAPIIALHGTSDKTVPYGPTAQWADAMSNVKLWSYPGAGHGATKEMAKDWTSALTYFLERGMSTA